MVSVPAQARAQEMVREFLILASMIVTAIVPVKTYLPSEMANFQQRRTSDIFRMMAHPEVSEAAGDEN